MNSEPASVLWARDDRYDRVYAIGDVHGRSDLVDGICALIAHDLKSHPAAEPLLCFLGDYIDRGADSAGVVDQVARLVAGERRAEFKNVLALRGNHEDRLLDFLMNPRKHGSLFLRYGGRAALDSWGVAAGGDADWEKVRDCLARAIHPAHLAFLRALPPAFEWRGHLFVHAGVDPDKPLAAQTAHDLCWIRETFAASTADHGLRIVHGHIEGPKPVLRYNRIGVDTSAYATGRLTCLVLGDGAPRFLATAGPYEVIAAD